MLLAIDVGNSNTVIGWFEGAKLVRQWRVSTHPVGTADEFRMKLAGLMREDVEAVGSVIVSSVVPAFTEMLRGVFKAQPARFISAASPFSFTIKADPPSEVGADRLVNAEAAVREHGAPAIIVDSGTATTICAISPEREYLGGAILPGIELSIETLARRAAKLFAVELERPERAIGRNTREALQSGILLGYASMVDGMVRRFKRELRVESLPVIATGGVATLLRGLATDLEIFDPDLTLKGLAYLHDAYRKH